jgi:quinol monooxygenase YgiN
MAKALSIVKHPVSDYAAWRTVYEEVQPLRDKHGVSAADVLQDPADPNNVTVLHWFPSEDQAQAFVSDPSLKDAMAKAGVTAPPRIEIVLEA